MRELLQPRGTVPDMGEAVCWLSHAIRAQRIDVIDSSCSTFLTESEEFRRTAGVFPTIREIARLELFQLNVILNLSLAGILSLICSKVN